MKKQNTSTSYGMFSSIWPLIVIFIIWISFSSPYILHGYIPFPGDNQQYAFSPWDAYVTKGPIKNPALTDVISQLYPWKTFTISSLKQGIIPFWNPYSFSGVPHLANYQSAVFSPLNLLFLFPRFNYAWGLFILLQPLLAGVFMYLFLRSIKVSRVGGIISSVGFMFCGFMTVWLAWGTLDYAILFLPLALFSVENYFNEKQSRYLFLLMVTIPCSLLSGHFQISLYFLTAVFAYIIGKYITTKALRESILACAYLCFGILIAAPQIFPSLQLYSQSLRSSLFQKSEAIPWSYIPTLIIPDFFGNPVTRNDWYGHYAEWNLYIGLLPIILAAYAVLRKRTQITYFFIIVAVMSSLLAFSTPLLDFVIALHIPVLSTSAASRIIVLSSFSLLVLAGIGYDAFYNDIKRRNIASLSLLFGLAGLVFAVLWAVILLKLFLPADKLFIAKQNSIYPTLLFLSILFFSTVFFFLQGERNFRYGVTGVFILIAIVDMFRFSGKWIPFTKNPEVLSQTPITLSFHPPSYERVLGNYGAEMSIPFHYPSVDGYDAVYIKRYGEFIHFINTGTFGESEKSLVSIAKNSPLTWSAVNLMNVSYIIHKISDGHAEWVFHFWDHQKDMKSVYNDSLFEVYKNTASYPHVFLVSQYLVETEPKKILTSMFNSHTNLRKEIILEENPSIKKYKENPGTAVIRKYDQNLITVDVITKHSALLFLSDSYYPDWQARVDGLQTKIFRADYTFRSIVIPRGQHRVTFTYYPQNFLLGLLGSVIAIVGGLLLVPITITLKKRMPVN